MGAVQRVRARRSARLAAFALGLAMLPVLSGCGERSEPTGTSVQLYPVTVQQAAGKPLILQSEPTNVAALTPQAESLVSSVLGHGVRRHRSGEPDLVVTTPEGPAPRTGHTYVAPDASLGDVEHALTDLGLLLDRPIRARRVVDEIALKRRLVRQRLAGREPVTVFVDAGFFTTVSSRSLLGDLIAEAGGRDIAGPRPGAGPFDEHRIARANPDYYLATSDSGTTLADLRKDRLMRRLRAVRLGHFTILPASAALPGAHSGTELVALARYLHPNAFR